MIHEFYKWLEYGQKIMGHKGPGDTSAWKKHRKERARMLTAKRMAELEELKKKW